jgi:hypothetical protein
LALELQQTHQKRREMATRVRVAKKVPRTAPTRALDEKQSAGSNFCWARQLKSGATINQISIKVNMPFIIFSLQIKL